MADTTALVNEGRLEIRNSIARHLILIFMGACLFVAAALAAFAPLPYADNELVMRVGMGYLGLPLSVALVAFNLRKVISRRCALLIDEAGITDHTTALSSGFTAWEDISEVFLLRLKGDDYLCAVPVDYEAWLAGKSAAQRKLAEANVDAGFAPIRIQFKKVTDRVSSKEGVAFVKRLRPKIVTHVRKPKY